MCILTVMCSAMSIRKHRDRPISHEYVLSYFKDESPLYDYEGGSTSTHTIYIKCSGNKTDVSRTTVKRGCKLRDFIDGAHSLDRGGIAKRSSDSIEETTVFAMYLEPNHIQSIDTFMSNIRSGRSHEDKIYKAIKCALDNQMMWRINKKLFVPGSPVYFATLVERLSRLPEFVDAITAFTEACDAFRKSIDERARKPRYIEVGIHDTAILTQCTTIQYDSIDDSDSHR